VLVCLIGWLVGRFTFALMARGDLSGRAMVEGRRLGDERNGGGWSKSKDLEGKAARKGE